MFRILCLLLCVYSCSGYVLESGKPHYIVKRSISERNLTDPGGCIQNCSVVSFLPKDLENSNPIALNCFVQKERKVCYENCPPSDTKAIILDNVRPLEALCNAPSELLTEDSACVRNQSLDLFKPCDEQCPPVPADEISPAVVVDPFFTHSILVRFESDPQVVEKSLKDLCGFGTCQWSCKKPIFEKVCGPGTADRIEIGYNLAFVTIPQLYVDLKVINEVPDECKKYVIDTKRSLLKLRSQKS